MFVRNFCIIIFIALSLVSCAKKNGGKKVEFSDSTVNDHVVHSDSVINDRVTSHYTYVPAAETK